MASSSKTWIVAKAKAKFKAVLKASVAEEPQMVPKRGEVEAVPAAELERRPVRKPENLKEWLLMPGPPRDIYIPPRGRMRRRKPIEF